MEKADGEKKSSYRDGLAYIAYNTKYDSIVLIFRGTISKTNVFDDAETN